MRNFIRLTDLGKSDIYKIFAMADDVQQGKYDGILKGRTVVMFMPQSSIRTRVTFEKGIHLLGGQPILFPSETLEKREELKDVCGYVNNWADLVVVRYKDIKLLEHMTEFLNVPVINAMTAVNHPCEIITDLYALSKRRADFTQDNYLFVGAKGNIGLALKEAAEVMGFTLEQCCGKGYEIDGIKAYDDISEAVRKKDIICTDSLPKDLLDDFKNCQVTLEAMKKANTGALLDPCPPFYRGEEVSADAIESEYFVGYDFKKCLLEVQQAIMIYCMMEKEVR